MINCNEFECLILSFIVEHDYHLRTDAGAVSFRFHFIRLCYKVSTHYDNTISVIYYLFFRSIINWSVYAHSVIERKNGELTDVSVV